MNSEAPNIFENWSKHQTSPKSNLNTKVSGKWFKHQTSSKSDLITKILPKVV
jgi:hypothetical protein